MLPRVSVQLVASNSMATLPDALSSLATQSWSAFRLRIIDNGSNDGLDTFFSKQGAAFACIRNPQDRGIAVAHNQGIRLAVQAAQESDWAKTYVLLLAPDTTLGPECLALLVAHLDTHPTDGAVGPMVLKLFEENRLDEALRERVASDHIASSGRVLTRSCVLVDRGEGEVNQGQFDAEMQVFAPAEACVLLRLSALIAVRQSVDAYIDTDMRTEEALADLAWRLQRGGWGSATVPQAFAYTFRGLYQAGRGTRRMGYLGLRERDRLLCLLQHVSWGNLLWRSPRLVVGAVQGCGRALLRDPYARQHLWSGVRLLPRVWRKRRAMHAQFR